MKYPNGKKLSSTKEKLSLPDNSFSNRGMSLEADINVTNNYYLQTNKAVIHKKPTPVQIVNVNYPKRSAAVITEAYFKQASTTDYNGIYRNKYIDFEAKETNHKTRFPLANIHNHQIEHLDAIIQQGGIGFIIIRFTAHQETYFMKAKQLFRYWNDKLNGGRKSIPYDAVKSECYEIPFHYYKRVDYISIIDKLYF
ncbi:Holliday junction resolvase RecU [Oceanobacillus halotolerans]|uniref:Holliday junction resolvase RecU n=1 Tax=Oceanobacillus halotolerans TaxID=2663380 RepID=UPI0013DA6F3D|nr:Holliday junction resolvase RecU [Oceanobacillus halotolerans]